MAVVVCVRLKAQQIIDKHCEDRAMARYNDPERYNCQPVITELAVRHAADEQQHQQHSGKDSELHAHY